MLIVPCQMICHTTLARVHLPTPECLFVYHFTGSCFDKWWSCEEYTALFTNNDVLICHGGNICST